MTFEARDSAAKVVPARLKYSATHHHRQSKPSPAVSNKLHSSLRSDSRRSTSCQTKWEQGVFRVGQTSPSASEVMNRRALTLAFVQFSKNLQQAGIERAGQSGLSKSPSAPNLAENPRPINTNISPFLNKPHISPRQRQKRSRNSLHPVGSGCTLLNPHALLQRQALSMDNPDYNPYFSPPRSQQLSREHSCKESASRESLEIDLGAACQAHGSQTSMAMDLHLPNDCPVTLRVKDRTRRSDTAKRHIFVRQHQIEDEESSERRETHSCSPRLPGYYPQAYDEIQPYSRSTPHSRRESLSKIPVRSNTEDHSRSRSNTNESLYRRSSISKKKYTRTNTIDERRRGSNVSEGRRREKRLSRSNTDEKGRHSDDQSAYLKSQYSDHGNEQTSFESHGESYKKSASMLLTTELSNSLTLATIDTSPEFDILEIDQSFEET